MDVNGNSTLSIEELKKWLIGRVADDDDVVMGKKYHSLIRGVLRQTCSTGAKNFTKWVFYHVQFSGVIQNIAYLRAIKTKF